MNAANNEHRSGSAGRPSWWRLGALVAALAGTGVATVVLAGPWLTVLTELPAALPGRQPLDASGPVFTELVAAGCAAALALCWCWLAAGTLAVAAQALRSGSRLEDRPLRWVPAMLRMLVPVALGVTATAAPAGAAVEAGPWHTPHAVGASGIAGLPVPDRAPATARKPEPVRPVPVGPVPAHPAPLPTVVVRPGDSLWSITARLLPATASPADVDRGWRRLARANPSLGDDPDLILPGTRLRVPPSVHPRKELP